MADFSKEYTIKKLEANEFQLIIPLMKNCFGMDVNLEYFRWKFLDNPAGPFIGFVAEHNETGEIGAYYGVIPERYRIDGQERTIYQSCDTMTHTGHRRRGLFQLLALHCYQYLRDQGQLFVIGFSGGQSTPGFIKFGWKHVFSFRNFFIPKQLCYLNTGFLTPADAIVAISNVQDIAHLLEKGSAAAVQSVRDPRTVQWRYGNPRNRYEVQAYRKNGNYEGYICYYVENNKIFLFDFHFTNSRGRSALMGFLKRKAVKEGRKAIIAFAREQSGISAQLLRGGFLYNPFQKGPLHEKTPFIFYADDATMNRLNNEQSWYVESFDHDSL
ncbi:MAG: GNAT family N-acetyltransferase [Chitinophagaceae bacterium]|nr:MAG: GNAT family N-acetyltransferase [Chitinophagaceae bacterium]